SLDLVPFRNLYPAHALARHRRADLLGRPRALRRRGSLDAPDPPRRVPRGASLRGPPGRPGNDPASSRRPTAQASDARGPRARALGGAAAALRVSADREGAGALPGGRLAHEVGRPLDGRKRRAADRARAPGLWAADHADPRLPRVRRAGRRARHAGAARSRASETMGGGAAATLPGGCPMSTAVSVDPSISRTPLPSDAVDLATVCVLCSHNCGMRVDVEGGRISAVRADETNPITRGYICNKGFSIPNYVNHPERLTH